MPLTKKTLKKIGKLENWKIGKLENWKIGKLENWKIPFLTLLLVLMSNCFLYAQSNLAEVNAQLREIFSPLQKPTPARKFLYDMTAHMADSVFFTANCPDTSNIDNWLMLYEEMRNAAYDTLPLLSSDAILETAFQFGADTIPIALMDYQYYKLKEDALTTGNYFHFDTTNHTLSDKIPRASSPYLIGNIFTGAGLKLKAKHSQVVFRIDPQFLLRDQFTSPQYKYQSGQSTFRIDFGDGQGWRHINPNVVTHISVSYSFTRGNVTSEPKVIRMGLFDTVTKQTPSKITLARLVVDNNEQVREADAHLRVPGMDITIFNACRGSNPNGTGPLNLNKVIFYLEGYDALDFLPFGWGDRTAEDIYEEMIQSEEIAQLQNFGYAFVVINWHNSRKDMRLNAMHFVNFLHDLKEQLHAEENFHQFVVIGESIGGVIARFALTYMESEDYVLRFNPTDRNSMHNTRLLITLDSPHQGANIPLSVQAAYRDGLDALLGTKFIGTVGRVLLRFSNILLDSKVAKQVLIYHYDTRNPFFDTSINDNYATHPDRIEFMSDLANIGGRPRFCKMMALSNGSVEGNRQIRRRYDNLPRQARDYLMDFSGSIYARILGIRVKLAGADMELHTNPEVSGRFARVALGTWAIRVRFHWFGVRIRVGTNSISNWERYGYAQPICTSSGGIYSTNFSPRDRVFDNDFNAFIFRVSDTNDGNGLYTFQSSVGIPWLANLNADFSIYSDGFHWCFVPVESALDYSETGIRIGVPGLNRNIEAENINLKLNRTPFDVISAIPRGPDFDFRASNMNHLFVRNKQEAIFNALRTCDGIAQNTRLIPAYLLNREIGDEGIWLENLIINRPATIEAEFDIRVNQRNPWYEYPSTTTPRPQFAGIYSRENPFLIEGAGRVFFRYDATGVFDYQPPFSGIFQQDPQPLGIPICCIDYSEAGRPANSHAHLPPVKPIKEASMQVFPNPTDGKAITLQYTLMEEQPSSIKITDLHGQVLHQIALPHTKPFLKTTFSLDTSSFQLKAGLYLITLETGSTRLIQKIIVQ